MAIDHTNCTHPRTPAGRRACRAGNSTLTVETSTFTNWTAASVRRANDARERQAILDSEIKMTGATARKLARHAAKADAVRIQPRRSGARVSARNTTCVQAALHIDAHGGSCACGWNAVAA